MPATLLPVALGLFSAVTVAIANVAVKRGGDVLTARMVLSIAMAISVLPFVFIVPPPPAELWPAVLGAVMVHWFYQTCLIRSLHRGDLSLVFPVMRGLAPLFTAILAYIALRETLSPIAVGGLVMASVALIVFALPTGSALDRRRLDRAALGWAVGTALGIAAYAVVDAEVARAMPVTGTFVVWLFLLDWIGITAVTLWTRRGQILARVRPQLKAGIWGGLAGTLSYGAIIYAYTLTDTTALVTAIRETSVVFAALLGWLFLKEGFGARRSLAALALASGLVLMQLG
ncbi:MAG: DMT family transporter [Pseudomonadota bacterium]